MTDVIEQARCAETTKNQPMPLRVGAELVSTFLVCTAIYLTYSIGSVLYGVNMAYVPLVTGLIYAAAAVVFGRICGAHCNPAVTIAAMLVSKTRVIDGVLYIVAQVIGGIGAGFLVRFLLPTSETVKTSLWFTPVVNGFESGSVSNATLSSASITFSVTIAIAVELIAGIIIVGAAMRSLNAQGTATRGHALAMGLAYGMGAAMTYPVTGAALNPVRSTGIAIAAQNVGLTQQPLQQLWVFWICPVLAAAIVALVMIVAQMLGAPKSSEQEPTFPEFVMQDANEEIVITETVQETEQVQAGEADDAAPFSSQEQPNAQVEGYQTEAQADTDEGIERH